MSKRCSNCKVGHPEDNFYRDARTDKPRYLCRPCQIEMSQQWSKSHADKVAEYRHRYYMRNREKLIAATVRNRLARKMRDNPDV